MMQATESPKKRNTYVTYFEVSMVLQRHATLTNEVVSIEILCCYEFANMVKQCSIHPELREDVDKSTRESFGF